MGRKKHSSKIYKMGAVFSKHGQHKHMKEVVFLWNMLNEQAKKRKAKMARYYATIHELMQEKDNATN